MSKKKRKRKVTEASLKDYREKEIERNKKIMEALGGKRKQAKKQALEFLKKFKVKEIELIDEDWLKKVNKNTERLLDFFLETALPIAVLDNFNSENKLYRRFLEARDDLMLTGEAKPYMKELINELAKFIENKSEKG